MSGNRLNQALGSGAIIKYYGVWLIAQRGQEPDLRGFSGVHVRQKAASADGLQLIWPARIDGDVIGTAKLGKLRLVLFDIFRLLPRSTVRACVRVVWVRALWSVNRA